MDERLASAAEYLQRWHDRHPAATSSVLGDLTGPDGRSSYQVLADAAVVTNGPCLDLACGDGQLVELVRSEATTWLGLDRNSTELGAARRRLGARFPLVRSDAECLPLVDACLGVVVCHFALMLLQPLEAVLREIARVLRRGGLLVAIVPATSAEPPVGAGTDTWVLFRLAMQDVMSEGPGLPPIQDDRALEPAQLELLLSDAGFGSIETSLVTASKRITGAETKRRLFLTYGPDFLPLANRIRLEAALDRGLDELVGEDGLVDFTVGYRVTTARRSHSDPV